MAFHKNQRKGFVCLEHKYFGFGCVFCGEPRPIENLTEAEWHERRERQLRILKGLDVKKECEHFWTVLGNTNVVQCGKCLKKCDHVFTFVEKNTVCVYCDYSYPTEHVEVRESWDKKTGFHGESIVAQLKPVCTCPTLLNGHHPGCPLNKLE